MTPFIDADVLRYEIGHSAQFLNEEDDLVVRDWDVCKGLFDGKIEHIIKEIEENLSVKCEEPRLYLTMDRRSVPTTNRFLKNRGEPPIDFIPNFREQVATVKPYKGQRFNEKPDHYDNLTSYILNHWNSFIANGYEADDQMAIDTLLYTKKELPCIICSRDKDLMQVPGWHFSWECGKQGQFGPMVVGKKGFLEEKVRDTGKKLKSGNPVLERKGVGGGELFFLYQLLIGDSTDNIPGCPKVGHKKAYEALSQDLSREAAYEVVKEAYEGVYGEEWKTAAEEQGRLLWLQRYHGEVWEFPYTYGG